MSATTYGSDLEVTYEERDQTRDAGADTPRNREAASQDRAHATSSAAADASTASSQPQQPKPPGLARPTFTITEAATACSMSRKTITRKLPELANHGAAKDEDGVWRIPVEALLAVGLHPGRSLPPQPVASPRPAAAPVAPVQVGEVETVTIRRDRWDDVRIRLARAEAEASERGLALADARLALRALTAGPGASVRTEPSSETGDTRQRSAQTLPSAGTVDAAAEQLTGSRVAAPPPLSGWERMATDSQPAPTAGVSTGGLGAAESESRTDGTRTKRRRWWHSS